MVAQNKSGIDQRLPSLEAIDAIAEDVEAELLKEQMQQMCEKLEQNAKKPQFGVEVEEITEETRAPEEHGTYIKDNENDVISTSESETEDPEDPREMEDDSMVSCEMQSVVEEQPKSVIQAKAVKVEQPKAVIQADDDEEFTAAPEVSAPNLKALLSFKEPSKSMPVFVVGNLALMATMWLSIPQFLIQFVLVFLAVGLISKVSGFDLLGATGVDKCPLCVSEKRFVDGSRWVYGKLSVVSEAMMPLLAWENAMHSAIFGMTLYVSFYLLFLFSLQTLVWLAFNSAFIMAGSGMEEQLEKQMEGVVPVVMQNAGSLYQKSGVAEYVAKASDASEKVVPFVMECKEKVTPYMESAAKTVTCASEKLPVYAEQARATATPYCEKAMKFAKEQLPVYAEHAKEAASPYLARLRKELPELMAKITEAVLQVIEASTEWAREAYKNQSLTGASSKPTSKKAASKKQA